jgi:phosphoribosylglycinamide formyltransferase-1
MRYSFYISGKGTRLSNIIDWNLEIIPYIKLVVSDSKNNLYLEQKLKKYNIPLLFFDYDKVKKTSNNPNLELSDFINNKFKEYNIDYCFCFGNHILKGELLKNYHKKIINFHPSVLPMFPGRKSIDSALNSQSIVLGNTSHFIDAGIDTGEILNQTIIPKKYFKKIGYDGILNFQILMLLDIFSFLSKIKYNKKKIKLKLSNIKTFLIKSY